MAVVLALLHCGAATAQFSSPRPFQRAADEYLALLMSGSFEELERAAAEARRNGAAISDGQPKLAAFYGGVVGCEFQRCANRLTDELWKVREKRIGEWRNRHPDSVAAKISEAAFPLQYGWYARGAGFANTVSEEGWNLFRTRVESARRALEGLDAAAKGDPGWFEAMLLTALSQGWPPDRFNALYEEAARLHPDYLPIHFVGAAYNSPKWHGTPQATRLFIERAVELTRTRLGEVVYSRLQWGLWNPEMFSSGQADWRRMKAGFDRMIADYPDPWNVNHYARFACLARDWSTMAQLAATIGNNPVPAAWSQDASYYEGCRAQAARMTGGIR